MSTDTEMKWEKRFVENTGFELREDRTITGLASPYYDGRPGSEYCLSKENNFFERFAPGAWKEFVASNPDCRMCFQHDQNKTAARTPRNLKLSEDGSGLRFEAKPNKTSWADDMMECCRSGEARGVSVDFMPIEASIIKEGDKYIRLIKKATCREVSIVFNPAYTSAIYDKRDLDDFKGKELMEFYEMKLQELKASL